jgi:TPR repeat protein
MGLNNVGYCYHRGKGVPQDLKKGIEFYGYAARQGYEQALHSLERLAKDKHDEAYYQLGYTLVFGTNLPAKPREGVLYLKLAARHKHPAAMTMLARMYAKGTVVKQDEEQAIALVQAAAELGNVMAMNDWADRLREGSGVSVDLDAAVDWYWKAAEQQDRGAQLKLAQMVADGQAESLSEMQLQTLKSWLQAAANQGDRQARKLLPTLGNVTKQPAGK